MITLKNIHKNYQVGDKAYTALEDINITINQGEILAIIGESGAGKSTLLHCLTLLEKPSKGEVWVENHNLCNLSTKELQRQRQLFSTIFQHFNLVNNLSVFDNVALPLKIQGKPIDNRRIIKLLALVGLKDKSSRYPNNLSGGQKQRVAIARALVTEPKILLSDEATSALDPQTTREILALLSKVNKELGVTIILITHQIDVVKTLCHRFGVIDNGKLIALHRVDNVFNQPSIGRKLFLEGLKSKLPDYLHEQLQPQQTSGCYPLAQILFFGSISQSPVISELSSSIGIKINILQANVDAVGSQTFGILTVQLIGDESQINQSLDAFNQRGLEVEVLGYV